LEAVIKRAHRAESASSPKSKKDLDSRILMLDEILKRDKLLLRDKSAEKERGLQRIKKSLNLG